MNEQLNKLIEQYERETKYQALKNPPFDESFNDRFVFWLASRPTCGVEQRKFLDEVETGDWHDTGDDDPEFRIEGIMVGQETFLFRKDFQADLHKVIQGE